MSAPRLIGRVSELAELVDALTRVDPTGSGVALVADEPGVGKTRLVTEFARLATAAGAGAAVRRRCAWSN